MLNVNSISKATYRSWEDVAAALDAYRHPDRRSPQLRNRIALSVIPFMIKHCCRWYADRPQLLDDVAQDTFIYTLNLIERKCGNLPSGRDALAYLLASIKWQIRNFHARRDRLPQMMSFDADVGDLSQFEVALHFYDQSITDTRAEMEQMIESLGDRYSSLVELVWLDGYSYAEAGMKLGVPLPEVKKRIVKAKSMLGRKLLEYKRAA